MTQNPKNQKHTPTRSHSPLLTRNLKLENLNPKPYKSSPGPKPETGNTKRGDLKPETPKFENRNRNLKLETETET